jgi:Dimethyladenosine transferase (rRNA methylation)
MTGDDRRKTIARIVTMSAAMVGLVDRLGHDLAHAGEVLTPQEFDRVAHALGRVGAHGAALLSVDAARTMDADEPPPEGDPIH